MVKTLFIEQKFHDRCLAQRSINFGLIISGSVKDDECVFLLISSTEKDSTSIDTINKENLTLECQKVSRMLPAGAKVSGVYYCGSLNFNKSSPKIKEILCVIHQAVKYPLMDKFFPLTDRDKIFLQVDPLTKSLNAKSIGFDHPKDFLRPVDVKVRPVIDQWRSIKTHINLTLDTYLPAERQKEKIFLELQEAVTPFLEAITQRTRLLVDGDLKSESDHLFLSKSVSNVARHSKRHRETKTDWLSSSKAIMQNPQSTWDPTNFTLFGPDFLSWHRTNSSSSIDSGHGSDAFVTPSDNPPHPKGDKNLTIHGRIPGLAFLPVGGTTVADALQAFRCDLTRSILLRLELLAEELQISGGELECARIFLPSRVLVRFPACPACPLSDYKFVSETPDDVVRRIALFCCPLGSATPPAVLRAGSDSGDRLSNADSGECSSDSEFNAADIEDNGAEYEEVVITSANDAEPVFDANCLDTELERAFGAGSTDNELPDLDIITDIEVIAHSVSKSKGKILLVGSALAMVIISLIVSMYLDLLPV